MQPSLPQYCCWLYGQTKPLSSQLAISNYTYNVIVSAPLAERRVQRANRFFISEGCVLDTNY